MYNFDLFPKLLVSKHEITRFLDEKSDNSILFYIDNGVTGIEVSEKCLRKNIKKISNFTTVKYVTFLCVIEYYEIYSL